MREKQVSFI